jgi:hypothetical protein
MIIDVLPEYRNDFLRLYENISKRKAGQEV